MSDKENFDPKNKIHIPTSESGTDHIRERTCTPKTVPNKVKSREHLKRSVSRKKHPSSPPLVPTTMRWKESDDHRLINIIQKYLNGNDDHGKIPWAKVSTEMKNRSGIACKSRWKRKAFQDRLLTITSAKNLMLSPSKITHPSTSKKRMKKPTILLMAPTLKTPSRKIRPNDDLKTAVDSPMGIGKEEKGIDLSFLNDIPMDFKRANPAWSKVDANNLISLLYEDGEYDDMNCPTTCQVIQFTPIQRAASETRFANSTMALPLIPTPHHIKADFRSDGMVTADDLDEGFYDQFSQTEIPSIFAEMRSPEKEKRKIDQLCVQTETGTTASKLHHSIMKRDSIESPGSRQLKKARCLGKEFKPNSDDAWDFEPGSSFSNTSTSCNSEDERENSAENLLEFRALSVSNSDDLQTENLEDSLEICLSDSIGENSTVDAPDNENSTQEILSRTAFKRAMAKKLPLSQMISTSGYQGGHDSPETPSSSNPKQSQGKILLSGPGTSMTSWTPAALSRIDRSDLPLEASITTLGDSSGVSVANSNIHHSDSSPGTPLIKLADVLGTNVVQSTTCTNRSKSSSGSSQIDLEELLGVSIVEGINHRSPSSPILQCNLDKVVLGDCTTSSDHHYASSKTDHFDFKPVLPDMDLPLSSVCCTSTPTEKKVIGRFHSAKSNFTPGIKSQISSLLNDSITEIDITQSPVTSKNLFAE